MVLPDPERFERFAVALRHDHVIVRQRVEVLVHFLADCALCFGHDSIPSPFPVAARLAQCAGRARSYTERVLELIEK